MRYIHGKVKAKRGSKIKVTFSQPTRVLIMNSREYRKYKDNMSFTYYGGEKSSPYEFETPKTDEWHVVVEKGTYSAPKPITASVEITHPVAQTPKRLANTIQEADSQVDQEETVEAEASEEEEEETDE